MSRGSPTGNNILNSNNSAVGDPTTVLLILNSTIKGVRATPVIMSEINKKNTQNMATSFLRI